MTSHLKENPCQITVDPNGLAEFGAYLQKWKGHYSSALIFSDETVFSIYGEQARKQISSLNIPVHRISVPEGEASKTVSAASNCWIKMQSLGLDSKTLVIALGGGMVCDLASFISSCYMQGIDIMYLPTTLLAMVDTMIGGRSYVNLPAQKNIIGTIHHPKLILLDPSFLKTLDVENLKLGLAEAVKYAVILDPELFTYLEQNMEVLLKGQPEKIATVISQCCMIKAEIMRREEKEPGFADVLNYGRDLVIGRETTGTESPSPGEIIALGMSYSAHLSHSLGYVSRNFVNRQNHLLQLLGLPIKLNGAFLKNQLKDGRISFIAPHEIGKVKRIFVSNINAAMQSLKFIE